jgi:hypothetical protein
VWKTKKDTHFTIDTALDIDKILDTPRQICSTAVTRMTPKTPKNFSSSADNRAQKQLDMHFILDPILDIR